MTLNDDTPIEKIFYLFSFIYIYIDMYKLWSISYIYICIIYIYIYMYIPIKMILWRIYRAEYPILEHTHCFSPRKTTSKAGWYHLASGRRKASTRVDGAKRPGVTLGVPLVVTLLGSVLGATGNY